MWIKNAQATTWKFRGAAVSNDRHSVMQVRGGKEVTLVPGQTFYEGPNDVHTVGRNASTTEPSEF